MALWSCGLGRLPGMRETLPCSNPRSDRFQYSRLI